MDKEKELRFAAQQIRDLSRLLQALYGRLGVGAVYDTMEDYAKGLEIRAQEVEYQAI